MKRMLSIPDELSQQVSSYLDGRNFSQWICNLIKENLGVKPKGPIQQDSPQMQVLDPFDFPPFPLRSVKTDEFGTPIKEAVKKTEKVVKQVKKGGLCPHGIAQTGFCRKC